MSCGCGNSGCSGGCGGCTTANVSQLILNPVPVGVRACSPLSNTCGNAQPASPTPFYECAPQCEENHCQEIVNNYYATAICSSYAGNMPACGETVSIYFLGVRVLTVGSFLWNETIGYLEVTAFNNQTGLAILLNNCNEDNASAGTTIPSCTCFVVVDPPTESEINPFVPYVAEDFTAPDVGDCVTITVTNVAGLSEGDTITIGTAIYTLDTIVSGTTIIICNDGDGFPVGTVVEARNSAGQLQYPISVSTNCCESMLVVMDSAETDALTNTAADGVTLTNTPNTITVNNTSTSRTLKLTVTYHLYATYIAGVTATKSAGVETKLQVSVDGGAYTNVISSSFYVSTSTASSPIAMSYTATYTVLPGASKVFAFKSSAKNVLSTGTDITVNTMYTRAVAFGVAI